VGITALLILTVRRQLNYRYVGNKIHWFISFQYGFFGDFFLNTDLKEGLHLLLRRRKSING